MRSLNAYSTLGSKYTDPVSHITNTKGRRVCPIVVRVGREYVSFCLVVLSV